MGRIERDIKKKVKNTKEEYYAWYSKHKEQINQRLDESEAEIDLGNIKVKSRSKLYIFAGIAAIFIVVIIAIVLPLTFSTDDELEFYDSGDLRLDNVEADEFYEVIEEAGLNIVDLSDYEVSGYAILYSPEMAVKGGMVELVDEQTQTFATISMYTSDVDVYFNPDFEKLDLDNLEIYYSAISESGVYSTEAYTIKNDLKYYLNFLSIEEPENVLTALFM